MSNAAPHNDSQSICNTPNVDSTISSNESRLNQVNTIDNVPHSTSRTPALTQQHSQHEENDYYTSEEEFPEITEEEVEIWSRVERKRFHYRSFPKRDEYLLQQTLLLKPFEATTFKARADKWQLVATRCDENMRKLPENATGLYNFYFGHHAKQRFRVLMEAHYGLLNGSSNPMFISIYGEYSNIKSLVEKAYDAVGIQSQHERLVHLLTDCGNSTCWQEVNQGKTLHLLVKGYSHLPNGVAWIWN